MVFFRITLIYVLAISLNSLLSKTHNYTDRNCYLKHIVWYYITDFERQAAWADCTNNEKISKVATSQKTRVARMRDEAPSRCHISVPVDFLYFDFDSIKRWFSDTLMKQWQCYWWNNVMKSPKILKINNI
jgi:hypothetical protein